MNTIYIYIYIYIYSCNEEGYEKAKLFYKTALNESVYKNNDIYQNKNHKQQKQSLQYYMA